MLVGVKTITISDEVYKKLLSVKREKERFSELLDNGVVLCTFDVRHFELLEKLGLKLFS
ncbi:MAG: antitoxin VapB family protein [Candidatus Bathyarchaeota archaeon]